MNAAWLACALLGTDLDGELAAAVQAAAERAGRAVVRIETAGAADAAASVGSAVAVRADGWLLTSAHLAPASPASVFAVLPDGRRFAAKVCGTDRLRHVALLKIPVAGLPVAEAARGAEARVGQYAVALGRAWDAGQANVAVGIVSAKGRVWGRALQTDAKTSPANYGGALADLHGRVLGVLAPLAPDADDADAGQGWYDSGVGFAVPLDELLPLLPKLERGDLPPGRLGLGWKDDNLLAAPEIARVAWRSPAARAGLKAGDVLAAIDGTPVPRVAAARTALGRKHAGTSVRLEFRRGAGTTVADATLADKLPTYRPPHVGVWFVGGTARIAVAPNSAAAATLRAGDELLSVGGKPVRNRADAAAAVRELAVGDALPIAFRRDGKDQKALLTLGSFPLVPDDVPAPGAARALASRRAAAPIPHWRFVPEGLRAEERPALLLWVDAAPPKAEEWAAACGRWRVALAGPAQPLDSAAEYRDLVQAVAKDMNADPARIIACGRGPLAERLALAEPGTFVGVAAFGGPLKLPPAEPGAAPHYALLGRADDASLAIAGADAAAGGIAALDLRGLAPAERAERLAAWTWRLGAW